MVLLRRPRKNDRRTDPFYEFGSFGLTGCHRTNLLHPRNAPRLESARLAFIQGGNGGARLICLTPPVKVEMHAGKRVEVRWNKDDPSSCFLRYVNAPVVTMIGEVAAMLKDVNRSTAQGKLASRFRSRTKPLPPRVAESLLRAHTEALKATRRFADHYEETLPFLPDIIDNQRKETMEALRLEAQDRLPTPAELN